MSRPSKGGQYIGQTSGIHSIQEKDDIFETDIDNLQGNRTHDKNREFAPMMSLGDSGNYHSKITSHYEVPNMSSMLYDFTNKEQERVHQSFRIGNFVSLRDLPDSLMAGNVAAFQNSKVEDNLYSIMERRTYVELVNNGGYFSKFSWLTDPFERWTDDLSRRRKDNVANREDVHGSQQFKGNPVNHKYREPHKHISCFNSDQFRPYDASQAVGFLSEDDPYEASSFEVLRAKWINDSKKIYGEFVSSQADQALKQINKQDLPDMVGFIKRNLLTDWSDINFIIGSNPEDYIEIRFDYEQVDVPKGLHAYMNTLINTNDIMIKYRLRRIVEYWGLKSDDGKHLYYMMGPPWCRHKRPILYLKQFPQPGN